MSSSPSFFADPFKSTDDEIDPTSEKAQEVLKQPAATRWELWGYYLYYNGLLAYQDGFYRETPNVRGCDLDDTLKPCYIRWMNQPMGIPVSSMLLYVQAISFSIQFALFTTFGSLADYGRWNRYILMISTVIGCAAQIIPIVLVNDDGTHWNAMMGIMIIALISYAWSNYNFPPDKDHILGNVPLYNFIGTVVCGGFWVLNAIPYFLAQPRGRHGPELPKGSNHLTIGWKSIFMALREARKLRYLFMYIISYFMFSDAVSTTNQMINIVQGEITSFSAKQVTILNLASAVSSIVGCFFFLWVAKRFKVRTKTNLLVIVILSGIVPIWGCFGISLDNFGIKTNWELWVFYVWSGLFTAPIWAWQNTMLAELVPKGKENLFFSLFGVVNKASSWIGPVVIGAITEHTSNLWKGWPFVLALFVIATSIIFFIDVEKAKQDLAAYQAALDEEEDKSEDHVGTKIEVEKTEDIKALEAKVEI
ncbi:hypothetical protein DFQ28_004703 [Apophysomyces sp. BC1034]|nr:hypothetical protein DFQ28_004703 [Apophysomyces sp. BC1034]